jgi:uncharacterized protein YjiS (DUF1127 family)
VRCTIEFNPVNPVFAGRREGQKETDMNTITNGRETLRKDGQSFQTGVFGRVRSFFAMSRAERQLRQLDDRMLADIGLKRNDISKMVWGK